MSASQNKKKRTADASQLDARAERQAKAAAESKKYRTYTIIVAALFILAAIVVILFNLNVFNTALTAVNVNGTRFSAADFNFHYVNAYNEYRQNVTDRIGEEYASYFLPSLSEPLSGQVYDSETGETWQDFLTASAKTRMETYVAAYDEAKRTGFTLSEEQEADIQAQLDTTLQSYELGAMMNGTNLTAYLEHLYGEGMTKKVFEKNFRYVQTAAAYMRSVSDSMTYTDDQLDAYYAERADELDYFRYTAMPIYTEDPADGSETAMDEAKNRAQLVAESIHDDDSFSSTALAYVMAHPDNYGGDVANQTYYTQGSDLLDNMKDWMLDSARQEGDTEIFPFGGTADSTSNGYYVVMFKSRTSNAYPAVNAYVISVKADEVSRDDFDSDEKYNAAAADAKQAANDEAVLIEGAWRSGVDTLEGLMSRYTDNDSVTSVTYEDAARDGVDASHVTWLFDEPRAEGDVTVVETDEGYDVLIYTGAGQLVSRTIAEEAMKEADLAAWQESVGEGYEAEEKWAIRFARGMLYLGGK